MAETQAQANKVLGKYEEQVAQLLGMPVPEGLHVIVLPLAQYQKQYGKDSGANTQGTTIYVPDDVPAGDLAGRLVHELTHAIQQVPHGGGGEKSNAVVEAMAEAVRAKLGFRSEADLDAKAKALYNLPESQFAQASQDLSSGNFSSIQTYAKTQGGDNPGGVAPGNYHGQTPGQYVGSATGATTGSGTFVPSDMPKVHGVGPGQINVRNYLATYNGLLSSWGIVPSKQMQDRMMTMAQNGRNTDVFQNYLYQTPEFQNTFPGLVRPNGTLKMSPDDYISQKQQYAGAAAQAGVNFSDKDAAYLFRNNVSPTEFGMKVQAEGQIQRNPALWQAFNQQLKANGMPPLDKEGQMKMLMGLGNKEFVDVWNQASTRYAGQQAGVSFKGQPGNYTSVGQGVIKQVAGQGLSPDALSSGFKDLAQQLQSKLPLSKIQKFGLTKQDLVQLEFGGPRQAHVAEVVSRLIANESNIEDMSNKVTSNDIPQFGQQQQYRRPQA